MYIKDNGAWINIDIACMIFKISKSAYYEWLANHEKHIAKSQQFQNLAKQVISIFHKSRRTYGAARILKKLNKGNIHCSYKQVLEIMKINDLIPVGQAKYKVTTTNSNHKYKVFTNLLERNFTVEKPNMVWVGDITYIRTNEGWLYLATVIDLFSRKIIGYKMSNRMTRDLVIGALLMALKARNYPTGVIVHSDRGTQYASNDYKAILAKYELLGSMSKKGDCWDNAVAESFFATLKKEYVYQTTFKTRADGQLGIFDYIEAWYNKERIHSHLNDMSPNEFEFNYWQKIVHHDKIKNSSVCYSESGI
jgi:transposase InsO family protein